MDSDAWKSYDNVSQRFNVILITFMVINSISIIQHAMMIMFKRKRGFWLFIKNLSYFLPLCVIGLTLATIYQYSRFESQVCFGKYYDIFYDYQKLRWKSQGINLETSECDSCDRTTEQGKHYVCEQDYKEMTIGELGNLIFVLIIYEIVFTGFGFSALWISVLCQKFKFNIK